MKDYNLDKQQDAVQSQRGTDNVLENDKWIQDGVRLLEGSRNVEK